MNLTEDQIRLIEHRASRCGARVTAHPVLFNEAMIRAVRSGAKTQTRRPIVALNSLVDGEPNVSMFRALDLTRAWVDRGPSPAGNAGPYLHVPHTDGDTWHRVYPRWQPGDTLWTRETTAFVGTCGVYTADNAMMFGAWDYTRRTRPSIHMPKWASRDTLDVLAARPERVDAISHADAVAEGFENIAAFLSTWKTIYGSVDQWCWATNFARCQ